MKKEDVLFELGCEELPSASVRFLGEALAQAVQTALQSKGLQVDAIRYFATPRRLAVVLTQLDAQQSDQVMIKRGPAEGASWDKSGQPTQALLGFIKSCGVTLADLTLSHTEKGSWYSVEIKKPGASTQVLLPELFQQALDALPIAKPMCWGDHKTPFVRPVHWVVFLWGKHLIPATFYGIQTGRETCGHRYHHPQPARIEAPHLYESTLMKLKVMADFSVRQAHIAQLAKHIAMPLKAEPIIPDALLEEVTAIVEWPCVLMGAFPERFLKLPLEVLIETMQKHQKCFALRHHGNLSLLSKFVIISNIESSMPSSVIAGNEKVMQARLSDAAFFYEQDQKKSLASFYPLLETTCFHAQLGSVAEQLHRMEHVLLAWASPLSLTPALIKRALFLSKCDLMTGMVGEFPTLEGIMGAYYAAAGGEPDAVALALKDQYLPKTAQDNLPSTDLGFALALANRLDVLVGIIGIGQKPNGVKDPYKCRRHALAVCRLLLSSRHALSLRACMQQVVASYPKGVLRQDPTEELNAFILERLPAYFSQQGISTEWVHSVLAVESDCLYDVGCRLFAIQTKQAQLMPLMASIKRIHHLLKAVPTEPHQKTVEVALFEMPAEHHLWAALQRVQKTVAPLFQEKSYESILDILISLRPDLDDFFNEVMVMAPDFHQRQNRLCLLAIAQEILLSVADFRA